MESTVNLSLHTMDSTESYAALLVLSRHIDTEFGCTLRSRLNTCQERGASWSYCYLAMECRIVGGDYTNAIAYGLAAQSLFLKQENTNGVAFTVAEIATTRYSLGQYQRGLNAIKECAAPMELCAAASLALASYLNYVGLGQLSQAISAIQDGLVAIEQCKNSQAVAWRIALQRNAVAGYHFLGDLPLARAAALDALRLSEKHAADTYTHHWACYEYALLEQRAGNLTGALDDVSNLCLKLELQTTLYQWCMSLKAHVLRDMGCFKEAEACFVDCGWGEGDDGPLMLWLLQGRLTEARCAAEARLAAANAAETVFEVLNLTTFQALLRIETGDLQNAHTVLCANAREYKLQSFAYHYVSTLWHIAFIEKQLGRENVARLTLEEALQFGVAKGYLNFMWWHPTRHHVLLRWALRELIQIDYCRLILQERFGTQDIAESSFIRIQTFGCFQVWLNGQLLSHERWQNKSAGSLRMQRMLFSFARHRAPQSIEQVARYVWADSYDEVDLASNFHTTLNGLRRVFEPDLAKGGASTYIIRTHAGYGFASTLSIEADTADLYRTKYEAETLLKIGNVQAALALFQQIEQIYKGQFALPKAQVYETESYRAIFIQALQHLIEDDLTNSRFASGIERAKKLLHEDRWDTSALVLLIRAYTENKNIRAARRCYAQFKKLHGPGHPIIDTLAKKYGL